MVTLEAFLRGVAKIKSEAPTYREGGDGSDGTCDCIGLVLSLIHISLTQTQYKMVLVFSRLSQTLEVISATCPVLTNLLMKPEI